MNRRDTFKLSGALIVAGIDAPALAQSGASQGKTFVLVHGAYHGAWCWRNVAEALRRAGHSVFTPTLTGLGERAHLLSDKITIDTFVKDVSAVIELEDMSDIVLVGQGFAGCVVSGVVDRLPNSIRHLVFQDSLLVASGTAPFDSLPADRVMQIRAMAESSGGGVPPPKPEYFGVRKPEHVALLQRKLTPHPFSSYVSKLELKAPIGAGKPVTYITCNDPPFQPAASSRAIALKQAEWRQIELQSGHEAAIIAPEQLTKILEQI